MSLAEATVDIENTGAVAGAEVLRLYIAFKTTPAGARSRFFRPVRTLGGFQKVHLAPGEKRTVKLPVTRDGTGVWDEKRDAWCTEAGEYGVSVVTGEQTLEGAFSVDKDVFWNGL